MSRTKERRLHALFPGNLGGVICGIRRCAIAPSLDEVTCQTCRAYVEGHRHQYGMWSAPGAGPGDKK